MTDLLTLTDVSCRYGRTTALDRITLQVQTGARHAIVGPNGAGKSTLLGVIAGTLRPSSGQIVFDGRPITYASAPRRARAGIGRTFQTPHLFRDQTVLDNLVVAAWRRVQLDPGRLPGERYQRLANRCRALLALVGLVDQADTRAGQLPHGQQRLLDIAIALAGRPRLLLLDEPAAGLTQDELHRILPLLQDLDSELTVLLVDHRPDLLAALADTITVLHHGQPVLTGTPEQIHASAAVAEVYALPTPRRRT
jgi:branched-chain amino acid transport system ATP-binding protein